MTTFPRHCGCSRRIRKLNVDTKWRKSYGSNRNCYSTRENTFRISIQPCSLFPHRRHHQQAMTTTDGLGFYLVISGAR